MKLRSLFSFLLVLVLLNPSSSHAYADGYSMDQISDLQSDYQTQLKKKPRVRKAPARVKRHAVKSASIQQAAQLLLNGQQRNNTQHRAQQGRTQAARHVHQNRPVRQVRPTPRAAVPSPHIAQQSQQVAPQADSLFTAASTGNVGAIARLINQGINVNVANRERETALHMAAAKGHYQAVIYLLNHGANIHARTINNWLPIHHATRFRHANIANYLLQRGASPYARTSDGLSAVDMAKATHDRRLLSLFHVK